MSSQYERQSKLNCPTETKRYIGAFFLAANKNKDNYNHILFKNSELKVKCNEISTIFLLLKILFKNISHTNRKQNHLSKIWFCTDRGAQAKKIRGLRELYENEPKMAAPRLERIFFNSDVMFGELVFMTKRF